jgi:hypothetical protein
MSTIALCASLWLTAEPSTVVTLYNGLGGTQLTRNDKGEWDAGFHISTLVDEKNGFLAWFDGGLGGGFHAVEAAIFVAQDRRKRFVVIDSSTAVSGWKQAISVYDVAGTSLKKVSAPWFPKLKPELAKRPNCDEKPLAPFAVHLRELELVWQLPRKGTTAWAGLSIAKVISAVYRSNDFDQAKKQEAAVRAAIVACYSPAVDAVFDPVSFTFSAGARDEHPIDLGDGTLEDGVFAPKVRPDQMDQ